MESHGISLLIKKVALSDAGQYICNASNAFSFGTTYVNVSVYGKWLWITTVLNHGELPMNGFPGAKMSAPVAILNDPWE